MTADEAREFQMNTKTFDMFRNFLFSRVIPNLKRIGLLTESIRPKYEELGILEYENAASDYEIDWAEISKPLESSEEVKKDSDEMLAAIQEAQANA